MDSLHGVTHYVNSSFSHSDHSNISENKSRLLKAGILLTVFIVFILVSNSPASYAYTLLTSIQVGTSPEAVAFDSATGNVYVANYGSNTVSVINGNSVTATISVGSGPDTSTSGNGNVYVANYGGNSISVITGNSVTATIGSVTTPSSVVFDSSNTNMYAAEINQNSVAVISTQNTSPTATTTSVASSLNPSTVGQTVTFTATVSSSIATGTIQFDIDGVAAGSPMILTGGQAVLSMSTLTAGTHQITATYSGDSNDLGSTSTVLTQTINQVVVTVSPSPTVAIQNLISTVQSMNINHGQTDNLDKYLNTAINYLNSVNNSMAVQYMDDFIVWTNNLNGKQITSSQATQLVSQAQNIISIIP